VVCVTRGKAERHVRMGDEPSNVRLFMHDLVSFFRRKEMQEEVLFPPVLLALPALSSMSE
jgi:hypothetical protein